MPTSTVTTAARLIGKLLDDGTCTLEALASRIGVTPAVLESYQSGARPMPLDRQMRLAVFASLYQAHARLAQNLHGQLRAAAAYKLGVTKTHLYDQPTSNRW